MKDNMNLMGRAVRGWLPRWFLITPLLLASCAAVQPRPPGYRVVSVKEGDSVAITVSGHDVIVDVRSRTGIGSAAVEQVAGGPPPSLIVRLFLRGLEELRFSYGDVEVIVSIPSRSPPVPLERVVTKEGVERSIAAGDPYWMDVKIVSSDPNIPLADGYFQVNAPNDFLSGGLRGFRMRWVDFYR